MKHTSALLLVFCMIQVSAQFNADSVSTLPEVEKLASASTLKRVNIRTVELNRNLHDLLREQTGIFLRNYGNGQLSSISFRGTGAAQTDVMWNGVKLNSPALGQVDASLFNLGMLDRVIVNGVAQSGNVGGELHLQSNQVFDSAFSMEANLTYGSFNTLRVFSKASFNSRKFSGTTRIGYMQSDNNFGFANPYKAASERTKLTHAKVRLLNFMQQFSARIDERNTLHFHLWLSDAQREIPPILSKNESSETQDDYSIRGMAVWNGSFKKWNAIATAAFFHDVIDYNNAGIALHSKSTMQALRNSITVTYDSLRKFSLQVEAGYDFEKAMVPAYQNSKLRHVARLALGAKYRPVESLLIFLRVREYLYDKQLSPFSPSLNVTFSKTFSQHAITVAGNAARNFRFPTLNDLYWQPGGNLDLLPEKSWDGDLGFRYNYKGLFSFKVNGYCKYITNWIQWIPNGQYWQPQNIKRVLSRGVELSANSSYSHRNFMFIAYANYSYTRATGLDVTSAQDQSKGKQLIYVPLHVANMSLYFSYHRFFLKAVNTYTDAVFTTSDNSEALQAYYLLDVETGKDFTIRNIDLGFSFRVNNITDRQYQTVAQRPMAGRSFEGILKFNISKL